MSITRNTFNENKAYEKVIKMPGTPAIDAEYNEAQDILWYRMRRILSLIYGSKGLKDRETGVRGFKITESSSPPNNFLIKEGSFLADGQRAVNEDDVEYTSQDGAPALSPPSIDTREDRVYLHIWYEEIGKTEDPDIKLVTPAGDIESARRLQMKWFVGVAEGEEIPESDEENTYVLLAIIVRDTGANITEDMIQDVGGMAEELEIPTKVSCVTGGDTEKIPADAPIGFSEERPKTCYIRAEWGDKGEGTGSTNAFTVKSNRVGVYIVNEWSGKWLTDSLGIKFKVVSNTTDVLTVVGLPASGTFVLGVDSSAYVAALVPVTGEFGLPSPPTEQWDKAIFKEVRVRGFEGAGLYATSQSVEFIGLPSGESYKVFVASKGNGVEHISAWSVPVEVKTGVIYISGSPVRLTMTNIVVTSKSRGIEITWPEVQGISHYEYCWSGGEGYPSPLIPDFDNPDCRRGSTVSTKVMILAPAGELISILVRAVDRAGITSSNESSGSAVAGGIALEGNYKLCSVCYDFITGWSTDSPYRWVAQIPLLHPCKIVRMIVYTKWCDNELPIQIWPEGDLTVQQNFNVAAGSYENRVVNIILPVTQKIMIRSYKDGWNHSPDYGGAGNIVFTYQEGDFS